MVADAKQEWLDQVAVALRDGTARRLSLSSPRQGGGARRVLIRPVTLRSGPCWQVVWQLPTQDVTKNLPAETVLAQLADSVGTEFRSANLFRATDTVQLEYRDGKRPRVIHQPAVPPAGSEAAPGSHDRTRIRRVDVRQPWLAALGVTTAEGTVCKGMEAKFRQIHRFVELLTPLLSEAGLVQPAPDSNSPNLAPLRVADMGCGKAYLTFALHEHLRTTVNRPVHTRGIEARPELVEKTRRVATELGITGLEFLTGPISATPPGPVDVLVALHACDTATDDALAAGVAAQAALLVVSPCCHREVRPQLRPTPALAGPLRHGILRERAAEWVTDALRAALLEWAGYDTRVLEFISPEHTGKNLMIAAVRRGRPTDPSGAARRVRDLAALFGVQHQRLAQHLGLALTVLPDESSPPVPDSSPSAGHDTLARDE